MCNLVGYEAYIDSPFPGTPMQKNVHTVGNARNKSRSTWHFLIAVIIIQLVVCCLQCNEKERDLM